MTNGTERLDISGVKIAVVDDAKTIRMMMSHTLRSMGCEVECAEDGYKALGMLRRFKPDLIFLDITMPELAQELAKAKGVSTQRGAFFDSVIDRVADSMLFGGVAWYLAGDSPRLALLPFAVMSVSSVISYMRAKAESLGLDAKGGIMERVLGTICVWKSHPP